MKHIKLYENFDENGKYLLYHYTSLKNVESIVESRFLKGYKGSALDEDQGETISLTRDSEYHKKHHDIHTECRLVLKGKKIKKNYEVHDFKDRYEEFQKKEWMKKGYSEEESEALASESQELVITDSIYLKDYLICIDFFERPNENLIRLMKKRGIAFNMLD